MKISSIFLLILLIYILIVSYMYFNQRKLCIYSENNYLDDPIEFKYKEVFIEVEENLD